jgi:Leucine-rich repeat (LRR) protein
VRWGVATLIAGACVAFGFSPQSWVSAVLQTPPTWINSPWTRLAAVCAGVAIFVLTSVWERRGRGSAIDRQRNALVESAFATLNPDAREWLTTNYAGGRPPDHLGQALNSVHLIDRDFVGWTEIKPDLKPLVAEKVKATNSLLRRSTRKVISMTSTQLIAACLIVSIIFGTMALVLLFKEGGWSRSDRAKQIPAEALAHLNSQASAPISRLAELGWTVTPQPDRLQFSTSSPKLPDMQASADLFSKLERPFILQLQGLASLDGLHLLAGNPQCTEIGIGAGEFTDTSELGGFENLTKLSISQTPLNGKGILDASPLGKLINLRALVLNSSRVKDPTFIASLTNLETLNLGQTLVTDISPVSSLSKLKSFDIRGTRVTDLRPLKQSLALRELEIGGAQMPTLNSLAHLDALKQLRIIEQGDVDLSPIASLVTLEELFMWGPLRVDAANLRPLKALKNLQISGFGFQQSATAVANTDAFSDLTALEVLTLGSLQLNNLDFVKTLTSLTSLNLNELPITSIEPVRALRALKSISLTTIPVVDITPLVDLPVLEEVRIMRTPARSDAVSALEKRGVKVTVY